MKIKDFEKGKALKQEFDEKKKQLQSIRESIEYKRIPVCEGLRLVSYGSNVISWDVLDWGKMLKEAEARLAVDVEDLKTKFESL